MNTFICPICGEDFIECSGEMTTLLGDVRFVDNEGKYHNHDTNCRKKLYTCRNGHNTVISKRQTCWCGWKGKETCFCHEGKKVEEYPEINK